MYIITNIHLLLQININVVDTYRRAPGPCIIKILCYRSLTCTLIIKGLLHLISPGFVVEQDWNPKLAELEKVLYKVSEFPLSPYTKSGDFQSVTASKKSWYESTILELRSTCTNRASKRKVRKITSATSLSVYIKKAKSCLLGTLSISASVLRCFNPPTLFGSGLTLPQTDTPIKPTWLNWLPLWS